MRKPKQERSRQLVSAVLEADTRILSKIKVSEATTNKIAEAAGVSIGSLYDDYFPNKSSIVGALIDQRIQRVVDDLEQILISNPDCSLEEKIDDVIRFIQKDFLERRKFLREIFLLAPETKRMEGIYQARTLSSDQVSSFLLTKGFSKDDSQQKSFLVINGALGIVESYIMLEPVIFTPDQLASNLRCFMRDVLLKN